MRPLLIKEEKVAEQVLLEWYVFFIRFFFHPTRFHLLIKMHDGFRKEIVCNFNVTD